VRSLLHSTPTILVAVTLAIHRTLLEALLFWEVRSDVAQTS
jgi:hypothetical protein